MTAKSRRGIMINIALIAAFVAVVVAVEWGDYKHERAEDKKLAQGAYDYGVKVGRLLGNCDALADVRKANPDSEWAHSKEVIAALDGPDGCKLAWAAHAPGTTETVSIP